MLPFPTDLPDLLRLACGQGKMRINVWFGSDENKVGRHQANLANSGNGWTVDYDPDPLVAMEKVLRLNYGPMLERERLKLLAGDRDCRLRHKMPDEPEMLEGIGVSSDEVEEAVERVLSRGDMHVGEIRDIVELIIDELFERERIPMKEDAPLAAVEIDEFSALEHDEFAELL